MRDAAATATEGGEVRRRFRKRGWPLRQINARVPEELLQVIDTEGEDRTDGLTVLLDRAVDARTVMGEDWVEVSVYAHRNGCTEGEALGRLALEGLKKLKK